TTLWRPAPLKCPSIRVLSIATSFSRDVTREAATRNARGLVGSLLHSSRTPRHACCSGRHSTALNRTIPSTATHSAAASGGDGSRGDRGSRQALRAGQGKGRSRGRRSGFVRRWRGGPGRSAWCSWEGPMTNLARPHLLV
ncbi:unnamed protein product, partial [Closterium sp. Naga37s-1]